MANAAFDDFYRRHYVLILRFAERRVEQELAQDVCAECFAIAWRKFDEADPPGLPWLYQTARNLIGSAWRKREREEKLVQRLEDEARVSASSVQPGVTEALELLKPAEREMLQLTYWEGLSAADVASVIGCSERAAWKRISRARERLREAIVDSGDSNA